MILHSKVSDWLRRRVGDTGPVRHWSAEYLKHAVEEAIISVVNDAPQGFTKIIDLPVNADNNVIDLPEHGVVFTRVYGEVDNGRVCKTFRWINETKISSTDACWRCSEGAPTHAIYTDDQTRIWLNGVATNPIRCSVTMLPDPLIDGDEIAMPVSYRNLLHYKTLVGMYGLTSNGAGKMSLYQTMYLQGIDAKNRTNSMNPKTMSESEQ